MNNKNKDIGRQNYFSLVGVMKLFKNFLPKYHDKLFFEFLHWILILSSVLI